MGFSESNVKVFDKIHGDFKHSIAYFHIHPDIRISNNSVDSFILQLPQGQKVIIKVEVGTSQWSHSHYAPEFGKRIQTQCLKVALAKEGSQVIIDWGSNG